MKLTQANFNKLVDYFNHKVTKLESDVKWIRWIGYYMAGVVTILAIGGAYG